MRQSPLTISARLLADLPEFDPPSDLWIRIVARRRASQRRRQLVYGIAISAALAVLALLMPLRNAERLDVNLAALQVQSRQLEARLAELDQTALQSLFGTPADLRSVEQTLQRAYDRGASNSELAPLWRQRNELLGTLIAASQPGALITRI